MMLNAMNCAAHKAPAKHGEKQGRIIAPQFNGQVSDGKKSTALKTSSFTVQASNGRVVVTKSR